jgi:putative ubiquitin-RnfH superfamily antitoxin RatB of RatAB toxin-antitoxin module
MTKVRVVIYLAADQVEALKRLQVKTGASVAELCRRAIGTWLKRWSV